MNDSEKLKQFMLDNKFNQNTLSAKIQISQQVISKVISNQTGKQEATPALKFALLKYCGFDIEANCTVYEEKNPTPAQLAPVPFYSAKVAAGLGAELPTYPEKDILYFDKRLLNNVVGIKEANAVILQAEGDSMDSGMNKPNDIRNGDLLMIDVSQKEIVNNKPYVVELNNSELVVKKVVKEWNGIIMLVSNNPLYPARPITPENEAKIVGRVVWNVSKENV